MKTSFPCPSEISALSAYPDFRMKFPYYFTAFNKYKNAFEN